MAALSSPTESSKNEINSGPNVGSSGVERLPELLHRLRIETALINGAFNAVRSLQAPNDKKALHKVKKKMETIW